MKLKKFLLKVTDSTNNVALKKIKQGNSKGIIIAEKQTKGKGQHGNKWISLKGNLFVSVFFEINHNFPLDKLTKKNCLIIKNTITKFASEKVKIKAPNDILIKEVLNLAPNIKVGTYGWVLGPMYETKAEISNMKYHGVNAVGMSTIPEVIMASQLNIDTLVLCLMSNYAVGLTNDKLSHQTVLINSIKHNETFQLLLTSILTKI